MEEKQKSNSYFINISSQTIGTYLESQEQRQMAIMLPTSVAQKIANSASYQFVNESICTTVLPINEDDNPDLLKAHIEKLSKDMEAWENEFKAEQEKMTAKCSVMHVSLDKMGTENTALQATVAKLEKERATLSTSLDKMETECTALQATVAKLEQERDTLRTNLDTHIQNAAEKYESMQQKYKNLRKANAKIFNVVQRDSVGAAMEVVAHEVRSITEESNSTINDVVPSLTESSTIEKANQPQQMTKTTTQIRKRKKLDASDDLGPNAKKQRIE